MEEELSACTRNGFQTEITLTTQCLLAIISAFSSSPVHWWKTYVWRRSACESWQRPLNQHTCHCPCHGFKSVFNTASFARTKPPYIPPPESTRTGAQHFAPRVRFVQWFLQWSIMNPAFPAQVLFTDEACFTRDSYFNSRNSHIWEDENLHTVFIRVHQARFNVNIWSGILGDYVFAGTWHHSRPFEWSSLPGIPPEHASAARGGDTPCDTQRNVVPTWWRSSALQPPSTSTSQQSLQREMDRKTRTCCMASKIARLTTPRFFFFFFGACEECCVH